MKTVKPAAPPPQLRRRRHCRGEAQAPSREMKCTDGMMAAPARPPRLHRARVLHCESLPSSQPRGKRRRLRRLRRGQYISDDAPPSENAPAGRKSKTENKRRKTREGEKTQGNGKNGLVLDCLRGVPATITARPPPPGQPQGWGCPAAKSVRGTHQQSATGRCCAVRCGVANTGVAARWIQFASQRGGLRSSEGAATARTSRAVR